MRADLPVLDHIVGLELPPSDPQSFEALLARGRAAAVPSLKPDGDEIAGFVYTSGTTGLPKGVMLSHGNLTSNIAAVTSIFPLSADDRTLSFLPWAHAFGQTCELHILISVGASTAINDELPQLIDNLPEVQPTILVAVPRIFNKIHAGVMRQVAEKPAFVRALFWSGVRSAKKRHAAQPLGPFESLGFALADKLIFSKVRARFGGRLKYAMSGSAALSREVAELIDALGIEVYEGYGLTETSPVVAMHRPGARKIGTVGQVIPGVRAALDAGASSEPDAGELIVYGPNVMKGYHDRPEENSKVYLPDGGFRTGIKEQYKLENGRYVMPSVLEEQLKLSPYIANVMLFGENKPFNVAVVVPNVETVNAWARDHHVALPAELTQSSEVHSMLDAELRRVSADFRGFEKPRASLLTLDDFTTENGLLTPTLKLKRAIVVQKYRAQIEALYASLAERPERVTGPKEARPAP
jgi:long-chain acyl-CoA synthetase